MPEDPVLKHILNALLIVAAAGILGHLVKSVFTTVARRLLILTKTNLDDRILDVIRGRIRILFLLTGFSIGIREVRKGLTAEHVTYHQILDYLDVALYFLFVLIILRLASKIITAILMWYMDEVSSKANSNLTSTIVPMASKIVNIVLFLVATMIVLDHFGINIGSLVVSLGVGSLAVALAAQETVANMIAGFVILVDQPFRVGDRIKLPSGEEGDIQQIGWRSTRILNYENNFVIIPNGELVKNRIINFSYPDPSIRVLVEFSVSYGTDVEMLRSVVRGLEKNYPALLKEPAPEIQLLNLGESGLQFRFIARTLDFANKFDIEIKFREELYRALTNAGIEIPFPQRVVHVKNR